MDDSDRSQAGSGIKIGVSSCLLGAAVRYDGGHKRDAYINGTLARYFELVPVCPEVAIGLGTPRQPIRLVHTDAGTCVRGLQNPAVDVTAELYQYGVDTGSRLGDVCGYVLKRGSPSCGMARVRVYSETGTRLGTESGMFQRGLAQALPYLPMEEEGRLGDPDLRENFIERVFVYARWRDQMAKQPSAAKLVEFHSRHKLQIMAHSHAGYRRLGRVVADAGKGDIQQGSATYLAELMTVLRRKATRRTHSNVLQHLMGYLKKHLDSADKAELLEFIDLYRHGELPLVVPKTLLQHHFRRHPQPYVATQYYLFPQPHEFMLTSQI